MNKFNDDTHMFSEGVNSKDDSYDLSVEPIKTQKVYQVIFNRIRDSIANGELKPGQKLPPERDLAKRFQVSRTSIREALRVLEINGIIEVKTGDGSFIRPVETQVLINDLASAIIKAEDNLVYEMLEIRRVLETECAALAALRASASDLEKLRRLLDDMANSEDDFELGLAADQNFHYAIAQATNSSILRELTKVLGNHLKDTIRITRRYRFSQPSRFKQTLNDHKDIYIAISVRDPERARNLMSKHITDILEEIAILSLKEV